MKTTLSTYDVADALLQDQHAAWTRSGALALAQFLEDLEDEIGELELDVVAIRCEYSEYSSLQDWASDYFVDWKADLDIEEDDSEEEVDQKAREYIEDHGYLIEFEGGIITSSF